MESYLTINAVVKLTGLSAHTLRYYERIGLISPIARAPGGQRRYASADMDWIAFLLRLRTTNMPIHRMQEFARLRSEGNVTAAQRRQMLDDHLAEVSLQIQTLQQSAKVLQEKIAFYQQIEFSSAQNIPPIFEEKPHVKPTLRTRTRQAKRD